MENYFKSAEQTQSVLEALKCYWGFLGEKNIDEEDDDLTFFSNGFFSLVNPQNYHRQIYDNRCQLFAPEVIDFHVFENGYYALSVVKNNSYQFFNPQGESIACFDDVIFCGQYRHFVVKKDDKLYVLPVDDLSQSRVIGSAHDIADFWDADDGKMAIERDNQIILYDKDFCVIHLLQDIVDVSFFTGGNFITWTKKKGVLFDTNLVPLLDDLDVNYHWATLKNMCRNMDATYDCLTAKPIAKYCTLTGVPNCAYYISGTGNVCLHLGNGEQIEFQETDRSFIIAKKFVGIIRQNRLVILALEIPLQQQRMLFDAFIREVSGEDISEALFDYGQKFVAFAQGARLNKRETLRYLLSH